MLEMCPNDRAMAEITAAIEGLTRRLHAYRVFESFKKGNLDMPLEIRGLKGKALKAAANLDRINQAYDAFNEAAPAHAADVEGLTPQIAALQDDLTFATQVLGNSVAGSGAGAKDEQQTKPPPVSIDPPQAAEGTVVASPEVGQTDVHTFRAAE